MADLFVLSRELGFSAAANVNMAALNPLDEVRAMCAANKCGRYGKSWSCPPACGTLEEAGKRMSRYSNGILVQSIGALKDEFDYDSMAETGAEHKRRFSDLARQARVLYPDCLPLTAGSCTLCKACTYPDRPCRYPNKRFYSMEAYGLFVSDICEKSGLNYNNGARTVTYVSCILY